MTYEIHITQILALIILGGVAGVILAAILGVAGDCAERERNHEHD